MTVVPHPKNFCGGNYQDWLEVMLLPECNGRCEWCVEKTGWHPKERASWEIIVKTAARTKKKNIILLGGEPTLHPQLEQIINVLHSAKKNVYITTNGSRLTENFVNKKLYNLTGINISIHHHELLINQKITGIPLSPNELLAAIKALKMGGCKVRFNCNLIKSYIDSEKEIRKYICFAKSMGATLVRFAELKNAEDDFVDLYKIFGEEYGLNDDPYLKGCNKNVTIDDMHVNFRQMCGLQTHLRPQHPDYKKFPKEVLYYDGRIYDGWQILQDSKEKYMDYIKLVDILQKLQTGVYDINEAIDKIRECIEGPGASTVHGHTPPPRQASGGGCVY